MPTPPPIRIQSVPVPHQLGGGGGRAATSAAARVVSAAGGSRRRSRPLGSGVELGEGSRYGRGTEEDASEEAEKKGGCAGWVRAG